MDPSVKLRSLIKRDKPDHNKFRDLVRNSTSNENLVTARKESNKTKVDKSRSKNSTITSILKVSQQRKSVNRDKNEYKKERSKDRKNELRNIENVTPNKMETAIPRTNENVTPRKKTNATPKKVEMLTSRRTETPTPRKIESELNTTTAMRTIDLSKIEIATPSIISNTTTAIKKLGSGESTNTASKSKTSSSSNESNDTSDSTEFTKFENDHSQSSTKYMAVMKIKDRKLRYKYGHMDDDRESSQAKMLSKPKDKNKKSHGSDSKSNPNRKSQSPAMSTSRGRISTKAPLSTPPQEPMKNMHSSTFLTPPQEPILKNTNSSGRLPAKEVGHTPTNNKATTPKNEKAMIFVLKTPPHSLEKNGEPIELVTAMVDSGPRQNLAQSIHIRVEEDEEKIKNEQETNEHNKSIINSVYITPN